MRVLAFEDSYDIEKMLSEAGVDLQDYEFLQYRNTMDCFDRIDEFKPDLLLLDHYIPPTKGLEVLRGLLELVCLLYTSPSPRDATLSRMPSSA